MRKPTVAFNSLAAFSSWLKKSYWPSSAVDKLFGAEQSRQSALDWIEELGGMDWPSGESIPGLIPLFSAAPSAHDVVDATSSQHFA